MSKGKLRNDVGVQIDGNESALYERAVGKLGVRSEYHAFKRGAVLEHLLTRVAQGGKIDFFQRSTAGESTLTDGEAIREVHFGKRGAAVERVFTDRLYLFEIDFAQLCVVVERVFAQELNLALYLNLFQRVAAVERVFSDFLDGIGNNNLLYGLVGRRNLVSVVVVLVYRDVVIGGVQTERVRSDVQHALFLGNLDHAVFHVALISHQLVVFHDERILNAYSETGFDVRAFERRRYGNRAFLHSDDGTVLIDGCNRLVAGLEGQRIFARDVPGLDFASQLDFFAGIQLYGFGDRGHKLAFARFAHFRRAGGSAVGVQYIEVRELQRIHALIVSVIHAAGRRCHNGRFAGFCRLFNRRHCRRRNRKRSFLFLYRSFLDVDYYYCLMRFQRFEGVNALSGCGNGHLTGLYAHHESVLYLGDRGIGGFPLEIFEVVLIAVHVFIVGCQLFG